LHDKWNKREEKLRHDSLFGTTHIFDWTELNREFVEQLTVTVCQELPHILWNPTVSRCVHNFKIHFNIILLFQRFILFRIFDKSFFYEFPMATCPTHFILLYFTPLIIFREGHNLWAPLSLCVRACVRARVCIYI
jgi:hypothetical protein